MKLRKTNIKRLCSCLLVLAMIMTFLPVSVLAYDSNAESYIYPVHYELDENGDFDLDKSLNMDTKLTYSSLNECGCATIQ